MGWSHKSKHNRKDVEPIIEKLNEICSRIPSVSKFQICGSYRREKEIIGDVEFLICKDTMSTVFDIQTEIINGFAPNVSVLVQGKVNMSLLINNQIQVDTKIIYEENWPFALIHFTGNALMNIILRGTAKRKGYKLNEYGIFVASNNDRIISFGTNKLETEKDIFDFLNVKYLEPKERSV